MNNGEHTKQVARALEVPEILIPLLPHILRDLEDLGCFPSQIIDAVRPYMDDGMRTAADLGCGKGGASIALAKEFGLSIRGYDAVEPFVEEARIRAKDAGVEHLCTFSACDLRLAAGEPEPFDAVFLLGVGDVFGDMKLTMDFLRSITRPGGIIVIEEAYSAPGGIGHTLLWELPSKEKFVADITAFGDTLLGISPTPIEDMRKFRNSSLPAMEDRVDELIFLYPHLESELRGYIDDQRAEFDAL